MKTFDDLNCALGEGPLWHPLRGQLFWFDILNRRMITVENGKRRIRDFEDMVSAAGWIDGNRMLIAGEKGLSVLNLTDDSRKHLINIEADNPETRSNDGRADPWGGFWIGTMGIQAQPDAGSIYRYFRGEVRQLYHPITISNSICFAPDRRTAYFTDTARGVIMSQSLNPADGWPEGDPQPFIDFRDEEISPDGAVVDCAGNLWSAQWGRGRVAIYDKNGKYLKAFSVPAPHSSCPAFGGEDLNMLFVTTAREHISPEDLTENDGRTFYTLTEFKGQAEHRVLL